MTLSLFYSKNFQKPERLFSQLTPVHYGGGLGAHMARRVTLNLPISFDKLHENNHESSIGWTQQWTTLKSEHEFHPVCNRSELILR